MFEIKKNNYFLILAAFFIDIISQPIFNFYLFETLLSLLIIISVFRFNKNIMIFCLFLLSIKALVQNGHFNFHLGQLLILIYVINKTKMYFSNPYIISTLYMLFFLVFQTFSNIFIYKYKFHVNNLTIYIVLNCFINLIISKFLYPTDKKSLTI